MKKTIFVGVAVIMVGVGLYFWKTTAATSKLPSSVSNGGAIPSDATVVLMNQDEYEPSEVSVKKGSTVVFVNKSSDWRWPASNLHPTHDIYPAFDPKEPVAPENSWMFRFDQVGEWRMHDHLAPYITGTVVVKE
jgi:plastocyanin